MSVRRWRGRRDGAQLVSFQDKLFLLGGWNQYAGAEVFESEVCLEVWCSDDEGVSWDPATTVLWSVRHMMGAVVHNEHIWTLARPVIGAIG